MRCAHFCMLSEVKTCSASIDRKDYFKCQYLYSVVGFFSDLGWIKTTTTTKNLPTNSNNKLLLEMLAFPCSKKRLITCSVFSGAANVKVLDQGFDPKSPNKFSTSNEIWTLQLYPCTCWEDLTPYWSPASHITGNSCWNCSYATISSRKSFGMTSSLQQVNLLPRLTKPRLIELWLHEYFQIQSTFKKSVGLRG